MLAELKYLILSLTTRCNLQCSYCYQTATCEGKDITDQVLHKALSMANTGKRLTIQITGGEPTLVPDTIQSVIKGCAHMKVPPHVAIQTNGTLLTESLVQLFATHRIEVGISLDGPPVVHDFLRGKINQTLKGLQLLENARIPFQVTTVVSNQNIFELDRLVLLLARYSYCRGIGLDLLVKKGRGYSSEPGPAGAIQLETGIKKMVETLQAINSKRKQSIRLRELDLVKKGRTSGNFCNAASSRALAVSPDGTLFPCGQTMGDPQFALGTVSSPRLQTSLLDTLSLTSEECHNCPLGDRCPGECPSRLYYNTGNRTMIPSTCILYKTLYNFR